MDQASEVGGLAPSPLATALIRCFETKFYILVFKLIFLVALCIEALGSFIVTMHGQGADLPISCLCPYLERLLICCFIAKSIKHLITRPAMALV